MKANVRIVNGSREFAEDTVIDLGQIMRSCLLERELVGRTNEPTMPRLAHDSHDVDRNVNVAAPLLLTVKETARLTQLGARTIWRYASIGLFPKPVYIGRSARWKREAVEQYVRDLTAAH